MRLALTVALVLACLSGCNVYHLAPNGVDSGPGTQAQPWKTFKTSLPKLQPGDTLLVHTGLYPEAVAPLAVNAGTPGNRITVMAAPGEGPLIVGYLHLLTPSFWDFNGINVTYSSSLSGTNELVRISGGTDWTWTNSEIWNAHATSGLHIDDGSADNRPVGSFSVDHNCIHDTVPTNGTNQDHAIYMDDLSGSPYGLRLIERNLLFNTPNGRGIKFGPGDTGGPHHVWARYNTIYNSAQNISVSKNSHDITLERNLLAQGVSANIYSFSLTGNNNVARDNAGNRSPVLSSDGTGTPVTDGGGNVTVATGFDSVSCSGLHPSNSQAQAYGRYAP